MNKGKIKFFWNEKYPETLYVMSTDQLTGEEVLYVLHNEYEDDPNTGNKIQSEDLKWHRCSWATGSKPMKRNGFEFIGEL